MEEWRRLYEKSQPKSPYSFSHSLDSLFLRVIYYPLYGTPILSSVYASLLLLQARPRQARTGRDRPVVIASKVGVGVRGMRWHAALFWRG